MQLTVLCFVVLQGELGWSFNVTCDNTVNGANRGVGRSAARERQYSWYDTSNLDVLLR